jgi:hypothetical protein
MTVEETERPKDTAATGRSLATMVATGGHSEQMLQSKQKDPTTALTALIGAGNATGNRTPRNRTMVCNIFPPSMNTNLPCQGQA